MMRRFNETKKKNTIKNGINNNCSDHITNNHSKDNFSKIIIFTKSSTLKILPVAVISS